MPYKEGVGGSNPSAPTKAGHGRRRRPHSSPTSRRGIRPAQSVSRTAFLTVDLSEQPDGLHGAWRVSDTELGRDVLTLVADRVVTGLSIGFMPGDDRWSHDRSHVERITATLDHVAIVRVPAYTGAGIAAVRALVISRPLLAHALRRHA